jgi:DNA-binding MarR family transcriptional regulator/N-acetylglutamate synthase-like GNAT family acetyltransferase
MAQPAGAAARTGDRDRRVAAVRRFNRFYTRQIGILDEAYLGSATSASELRAELGLDAGYASRILAAFERRGLIERRTSDADARRSLIRLTARGQQAFATLDVAAREQIGALIGRLAVADQTKLVQAMTIIEDLLSHSGSREGALVLRAHRSGDLGWVVQRHGELYRQEYGWDERFEALVAAIVARFVDKLDERRERAWIAELDGERVGCVFCVARSKTIAQLRLLLVEPSARGRGLGTRLVAECVAFARAAGYRKLMLWTNSVLVDARRLYERAGFRLVHEDRHTSFGHALVGQNWELGL